MASSLNNINLDGKGQAPQIGNDETAPINAPAPRPTTEKAAAVDIFRRFIPTRYFGASAGSVSLVGLLLRGISMLCCWTRRDKCIKELKQDLLINPTNADVINEKSVVSNNFETVTMKKAKEFAKVLSESKRCTTNLYGFNANLKQGNIPTGSEHMIRQHFTIDKEDNIAPKDPELNELKGWVDEWKTLKHEEQIEGNQLPKEDAVRLQDLEAKIMLLVTVGTAYLSKENAQEFTNVTKDIIDTEKQLGCQNIDAAETIERDNLTDEDEPVGQKGKAIKPTGEYELSVDKATTISDNCIRKAWRGLRLTSALSDLDMNRYDDYDVEGYCRGAFRRVCNQKQVSEKCIASMRGAIKAKGIDRNQVSNPFETRAMQTFLKENDMELLADGRVRHLKSGFSAELNRSSDGKRLYLNYYGNMENLTRAESEYSGRWGAILGAHVIGRETQYYEIGTNFAEATILAAQEMGISKEDVIATGNSMGGCSAMTVGLTHGLKVYATNPQPMPKVLQSKADGDSANISENAKNVQVLNVEHDWLSSHKRGPISRFFFKVSEFIMNFVGVGGMRVIGQRYIVPIGKSYAKAEANGFDKPNYAHNFPLDALKDFIGESNETDPPDHQEIELTDDSNKTNPPDRRVIELD